MATNAVKEESFRPPQQRYDLNGVKIEALEYGARSFAAEVPLVEISSSSSDEKSFTTAESAGDAMYPVVRQSQSKRANPFDAFHSSNGNSLGASSPKRARVGLSRGAHIGLRMDGRSNNLEVGSLDQRHELRAPDLPAGLLEPLEPLGIVPARSSSLPWLAPSFPFGNAMLSRSKDRVSRQFWKAGDYENDQAKRKSVGGGMDHVRVHPKFLHSNATSHKWALGAIAELLDNALDEVVNGATHVTVDMIRNPKGGEPMLLIQDDGGGMNPDSMRQCMSLGYSAKSKIANTIGQYGNGFKTSTMRLGADVIVFSRCPSRHGCGPTESIGMLSYTFLRDTGQEDIVVPMIDYDIQAFGLRKLLRSNVEDWNRNMETLKHWSPYSTESELLDQFKDMKSQGTKIIVYNLWEDDQGQLELDFEANPHDIQVRGANRDDKNIAMAQRFPNSKHYLTYRHSLHSYASILYLRLPQGFRMFLRGKEVKHHNLIDDLMYTQESTYKPQGGSDQLQREGVQMKAVVTVGFVKDAKEHIDVQGFNVYHKNRLIKPFWRIWNSAASRGRGIIGVLEANFVEPAHDKQGFERTIVLARLEARLLEMQKNYWAKNCHRVGYVNTSTKDKDGKQAYRGPSSRRPERSVEQLPDARSGPPELLNNPIPVPVSRSLRSQTPDCLQPLSPAGANPEAQVCAVPPALARALRSQTEDRLQLARQEVQVSSSSLDALTRQEQPPGRPSQTGQGSDIGAPPLLSDARSSLSQRHQEAQSPVQEQSEVQLPVIPFPVPKGLRSHFHERHQARPLHSVQEPTAQVPRDLPPPRSSLVQSQAQADSVPVPMDILSATASLLSQNHNLTPAPVCADLMELGRSCQLDANKESKDVFMQGTTRVVSNLPPSPLSLQEAQEAARDSPKVIVTGIEASAASHGGASHCSVVEAETAVPIGSTHEKFHTSQEEPETTVESGHISLATDTELSNRSSKEIPSPAAEVEQNCLMTGERSQGDSQKNPVLPAEDVLVSSTTQEEINDHLREESPSLHGSSLVSSTQGCAASLETCKDSHFSSVTAGLGLVAEVVHPLTTFEGSESPLSNARLASTAERATAPLTSSESPLQASPESSAALDPLVSTKLLALQAECDKPAHGGMATKVELSSVKFSNEREFLAPQKEEGPRECNAQNGPAHVRGSSAEVVSPISLDFMRLVSIEADKPISTSQSRPDIAVDFIRLVSHEVDKELPISTSQSRPDMLVDSARLVSIEAEKEFPNSTLHSKPDILVDALKTDSAAALHQSAETNSAPVISSSKRETQSFYMEEHLETDSETGERQRGVATPPNTTTSVSPAKTSHASPSKPSVRFVIDTSESRIAHSAPENSSKILKSAGPLNKDILPGRKSLEDLGRMFAKQAVATEKTRNGIDQTVTCTSHSQPVKETKVLGLEVQEGSKEHMMDDGIHSNNKDLEAQLAGMEQEAQILHQKLKMVTVERNSLRQQLELERKQWQLNKKELQTKLEETWVRVRELESRNHCLRQAQH